MALNYQEMLAALQSYWAERGCVIMQPYHTELAASTMNPATALRSLGPDPWRVACVEPVIRPTDGRYAENPFRFQQYFQYQVLLKPAPEDVLDQYFDSLAAVGVDLVAHDVRLVEDDWEQPTLGAWGLGWEVWIDGMEVTQFTYFQQLGGFELDLIPAEITYGTERLAMFLQGKRTAFDLEWAPGITWGDVYRDAERQWSVYNFEEAPVELLTRRFEEHEAECNHLVERGLPLPAYDQVLKCSHVFNLLDARGAVSVTERASYIARVRNLARAVCARYLESLDGAPGSSGVAGKGGEPEERGQYMRGTDSRRGRPMLFSSGSSAGQSPTLRRNEILPAASGGGEAGLGPAKADAGEGRGLLFEIGCEELPAWACREAEAQLPALVRGHVGVEPTRVLVSPRRLAVIVDDLPETTSPEWVKGPPATAPAQAREGFARSHGLEPAQLEDRGGFLGFERPGEPMRDVLATRLRAIIEGLSFAKSMRWDGEGLRFPRPIRWTLAKLDHETLEGRTSFGHRFSAGAVEVETPGRYLEALRAAGVEPDQATRRREILDGLDTLGEWSDPLGALDEVVYLAERPTVLLGTFDERFLALPQRVIVTAMQSHQRYFPLGQNRFAVVVDGGDPDLVRAGHENVLDNRLEDASFTFERDVAGGIEALAGELGRITFFAGAGTYADKAERVVALVERLGGSQAALEAARLAKADQAAELVREFPDLEGAIGAEYARLAGQPEEVWTAIAEQYLPDGAEAPLPSTEAGKLLSAADKIDTLTVSFSLGHRPSGSRDPYGLRRAAIALCRLALEGGVVIPRDVFESENREFVEERLEGVLDLPVEFVRAARRSAATDLAGIADRARGLAALDPERLAAVHEVYTRADRIAGGSEPGEWRSELLAEDAERELAHALDAARPALASADLPVAFDAAAQLASIVERFFDEVLVMADDEELRTNRLRLLLDLRDTVGALGDFSQLSL